MNFYFFCLLVFQKIAVVLITSQTNYNESKSNNFLLENFVYPLRQMII
jgi:hypothetical protein